MKKYLTYFLQGLLYTIPITVTVYVLAKCIGFADYIIDCMFRGFHIVEAYRIPGLGLLLLVLMITFIGYICPIFITPQMSKLINKTMKSMPLIGFIFTSVRDLMSAFVGKKRNFGSPVLVELDDKNIVSRLGFITTEDLKDLGIKDKVAVYLPNSYGMLGDLIIISADKITPINANPSDVMKFIVSGGVTQIKESSDTQKDADGK